MFSRGEDQGRLSFFERDEISNQMYFLKILRGIHTLWTPVVRIFCKWERLQIWSPFQLHALAVNFIVFLEWFN